MERSQTLKLHTDMEVISTRLKAEKTELSRQVEKLTMENEDLRRAFKKLLQYVVSLKPVKPIYSPVKPSKHLYSPVKPAKPVY